MRHALVRGTCACFESRARLLGPLNRRVVRSDILNRGQPQYKRLSTAFKQNTGSVLTATRFTVWRSLTSFAMNASVEKSVLVPIANGTEEMEAVIIIDVLRRAGANV